MVSSYQKRGLQAIFDSSQDGLVSLEAPWYLPNFCDFPEKIVLLPNRLVHGKDVGWCFLMFFLISCGRQKVGTPLKCIVSCNMEAKNGSMEDIPSGNHAHASMLNFMGVTNSIHLLIRPI